MKRLSRITYIHPSQWNFRLAGLFHGGVSYAVAQGSTLGLILMFYSCLLEILNHFLTKGPAFLFCTGPQRLHNCPAGKKLLMKLGISDKAEKV